MSTSFMSSKVVVCLACFLVCGMGLLSAQSQEKAKSKKQIEAEQYDKIQEKAREVLKAKPAVIDAKDDELQRLLKERLNNATSELETQFVILDNDLTTVDAVGESIRRWAKAGLELAPEPAQQVKVLEMQIVVSKFLEAICAAKYRGDSEDITKLLQAKNLRITAEIDLLRLKKSLQVSKGN